MSVCIKGRLSQEWQASFCGDFIYNDSCRFYICPAFGKIKRKYKNDERKDMNDAKYNNETVPIIIGQSGSVEFVSESLHIKRR